MAIPKIQAGGVRIQLRQPSFLAALALLVFAVAPCASAVPARLLTARFSGGCNTFTMSVTGEGLKQPNAIVSYNITLTPRSGEPMTIVDSFGVMPGNDGRYRKTIHGTWKKFEYALTDKYTLSGSAILASDLTLLHTLTIAFSRKTLNCS